MRPRFKSGEGCDSAEEEIAGSLGAEAGALRLFRAEVTGVELRAELSEKGLKVVETNWTAVEKEFLAGEGSGGKATHWD